MKKSILLCAALAALTACNGNSDNNKSLDYETIDVNFTLKSDLEIPEGTEFGVVALCAREYGRKACRFIQSVRNCKSAEAGRFVRGRQDPGQEVGPWFLVLCSIAL